MLNFLSMCRGLEIYFKSPIFVWYTFLFSQSLCSANLFLKKKKIGTLNIGLRVWF